MSKDHGWPVSPDFAQNQVRMIQSKKYDLIVEFGSGTTTWLSLNAIEKDKIDNSCEISCSPRLISFEHLEEFYRKTFDLVSDAPNRDLLDLRLSPLSPWADATGNYFYYSSIDCIANEVNSLSSSLSRSLRILVIIDGPQVLPAAGVAIQLFLLFWIV